MKGLKRLTDAFFAFFETRNYQQECAEFIKASNGKQFFCYNNRKRSKDFIEQIILPTLAPDIEIVFVEGKTPKSNYSKELISTMLYTIEGKGFPYLIKISDGKLLYESMHRDLYTLLQHNKDASPLLARMSAFYSRSFAT